MTAVTVPVIVIGGPTASGKSALALEVAARVNGAVINADSMQLYRGLPLLTAQPSAADKAAAPHLLYETLDARDACSAARWRGLALAAIEETCAQGRVPVIAGGTGFYICALLHGLSPVPDVPARFRAEAAALQRDMGNPAFHAALAQRDPETAARLDPLNTQRVVRAWEVLEATGKGLAAWQNAPPEGPPAHLKFLTAALLPPRSALYSRCDSRFSAMLAAGALEETAAFTAQATEDMPLTKALGYAELTAHLSGALSLTEAAAKAGQRTRNYAKKQYTWFRGQMAGGLVLETAEVDKVIAMINSHRNN